MDQSLLEPTILSVCSQGVLSCRKTTYSLRRRAQRRLLTNAAPIDFKGLVRVSSVSVASVLALLVATSILPPLVADQSDRAVMNAPVTLLTAPISGDVLSMQANPGAPVDRGTKLAEIGNSRVDRSTAIQLDGNVAEMRERAVAVLRKRESNQAYLTNLDQSIQDKAVQLDQILRAQISELKANLAEADAVMEQRRLSYDQTAQLASRNVTNANTLKPARQQLEAAQSAKDAANAKLTQKVSQLEGLSKGIYVGEDLLALAEISQKRREIEFDTQRLAIEEAELHARIRDQARLLDIENQRLDSLAHTTIAAPLTGAIFSTSATKGRRVNAGDTLATFVDCERRFVVAIFSYRKAPDLAVGTRVEIAGIDEAEAGAGQSLRSSRRPTTGSTICTRFLFLRQNGVSFTCSSGPTRTRQRTRLTAIRLLLAGLAAG